MKHKDYSIDCSARNSITVELKNETVMKSVKEVCELTGVTRKTLFYYDKIGLLKPSYRKGPQRQKLYNAKAIKRLCIIRILKEAGFRIEEIKTFLEENNKQEEIIERVKKNNQNNLMKIEKSMNLIEKIYNRINTINDMEIEDLLQMMED